MSDPEDVLRDSPADFDSSLAYALHGEMRRLLIVTFLGSILFPLGLGLFLDPGPFLGTFEGLLRQAVGLVVALVGAAFLFGGIVAVLFKTVTDATIVAQAGRER